MIKRIIAMSMAIILASGMMLPAVYADSGTAAPQVTVVGKRIIGDDKYFEISLEVDGDYEDYSSVGVVLQYDPSLIVPTTWDDEAVPVDMSQSTSWATRRALPTLGKDTWTTHTALTYITEETDSGGNKKNVGYLYLGAEYPGKLPNSASDPNATPDPNATASPTVAPTPTAEPTPTPDPNATPDPDPYVNPVVVARFMYVGADETAQKASKDSITNQWTAGNWDADWTKNKILTIAPDKISDASPAQFGFAYYNADFTMKGFQFDYTTTVLETAEQAQTTDIQIVLGEGKSAKAGGLSLNDIYVTLFYDWDDSLLGSFTCGVGVDSSADINEYVKTKFIHPELQNNTNYSSNARVDNYRGEYPCNGPGSGAVFDDTNAEPGSSYPLTNKLEYCFAGRDFNTDDGGNALPFVGGWTLVTADTLTDTWTALDNSTTFAQTVDIDGDGAADTDTDGNYLDVNGDKIDMVSYNFADVQSSDLDGGVLMVKVVYKPGEKLNLNASGLKDPYYTVTDYLKYESTGTVSATAGIYPITFQYKRINSSGNGVTRLREAKVRTDITQTGASTSFAMSVDVESAEVFDVYLTPSKSVSQISYNLVDTYGKNIIDGSQASATNGHGVFKSVVTDRTGFIVLGSINRLVTAAYNNVKGINKTEWTANINYILLNDIGLKASAKSSANFNLMTANAAKTKLLNGVKAAINAGVDVSSLTWYQLQYFILKAGAYADAATAQTYVVDNCTWL